MTSVYVEKSNPNQKVLSKKLENDTEEKVRRIVFLKYRSTETEKLAQDLLKIEALIKVVFTLD